MKRSNIILLICIGIGMIYFLFPSIFGQIIINKKREPADLISKFWMNLYPKKIMLDSQQQINHIKVFGKENTSISIEINSKIKDETNVGFPQNLTFSIHKDTLEIYLQKDNSYISLNQVTPIQSIYCTGQTELKLIPVTMDSTLAQLEITLDDKSHLITSEFQRNFGSHSYAGSRGPMRINNLKLNLSNQSTADLANILSNNCTAILSNSFLNCNRIASIDSLHIQLLGKSSINNKNNANMKNLFVSGNLSYFNKNFIHRNTNIVLKSQTL